ncbi:GntR family transcriptional regulator [Aureimonas sp. N4]|uniref:GntR family transcriptional regulator n=1 Tax=Aureimonas sp. N4 TaxID=1638165 RepID=UPI00078368E2|nr:GntR family transcriptional regulator [Aureimonas sp. N4]
MSVAKSFNTRPLYQQVADEFVSRIVSRTWAPGQLIENEAEIARSLGISLGTVRKAFDILTENKLLERHQGRGTVVVDYEAEKTRSRFSNILDRSGNRVSGDVTMSGHDLAVPPAPIADRLGLSERVPVLTFERRRTYAGRLFLIETVYLRVAAATATMSPAEMVQLSKSRWMGHDIATYKVEKVASATAEDEDRAAFGLSGEAAILTLDRVIYSYQNKALELRIGRCHLGGDLLYCSD